MDVSLACGAVRIGVVANGCNPSSPVPYGPGQAPACHSPASHSSANTPIPTTLVAVGTGASYFRIRTQSFFSAFIVSLWCLKTCQFKAACHGGAIGRGMVGRGMAGRGMVGNADATRTRSSLPVCPPLPPTASLSRFLPRLFLFSHSITSSSSVFMSGLPITCEVR